MIIHGDGKKRDELREEWVPVRVLGSQGVTNIEELTTAKAPSISFQSNHCSSWEGAGSWILLDFGRELCGGIRMVTRSVQGTVGNLAKWRLTFGESVTEACSSIGEKNATNDHSPRDFEVVTPGMSDLSFGQTGFRFVRIELQSDVNVLLQSVYAVSLLPVFDREATITTNDPLVNEIINTAARTLKLCFQNGYVWDGIKRDRLVWCGDLHPEIITSMYLFGDTPHITNSLTFLRDETPADEWVNTIPSYSAWWVINLCDYCNITGNKEYFLKNRDYALAVLDHFNRSIVESGDKYDIDAGSLMQHYLDWSTHQKPDAPWGVAALLCLAAQKFLMMEENADCRDILRKLGKYLDKETVLKPVRAFQVLAGRHDPSDAAMLQAGGAAGMSTFMAYYILTAIAKAGGTDMLEMLKTYYGGMLSRGATSFWEDFDIDWLEGSGRIDEFPAEGQKDIHGDFGKHCYIKFRHSLCHGWSSGVLAFIIEYIFGVTIADGGKTVTVRPHPLGLTDLEASIPLSNGWLKVSIHGDRVDVTAPEDTTVIR